MYFFLIVLHLYYRKYTSPFPIGVHLVGQLPEIYGSQGYNKFRKEKLCSPQTTIKNHIGNYYNYW